MMTDAVTQCKKGTKSVEWGWRSEWERWFQSWGHE